MSSDDARGTRRHVPFLPAGPGQTISRSCNGRKGQWLCGKKLISKGLCDGCAKAKQERQAMKVAA